MNIIEGFSELRRAFWNVYSLLKAKKEHAGTGTKEFYLFVSLTPTDTMDYKHLLFIGIIGIVYGQVCLLLFIRSFFNSNISQCPNPANNHNMNNAFTFGPVTQMYDSNFGISQFLKFFQSNRLSSFRCVVVSESRGLVQGHFTCWIDEVLTRHGCPI